MRINEPWLSELTRMTEWKGEAPEIWSSTIQDIALDLADLRAAVRELVALEVHQAKARAECPVKDAEFPLHAYEREQALAKLKALVNGTKGLRP